MAVLNYVMLEEGLYNKMMRMGMTINNPNPITIERMGSNSPRYPAITGEMIAASPPLKATDTICPEDLK